MANRGVSTSVFLLLSVIGFLTIETRGDIFDADLDLQNYIRFEDRTGIDIFWQSSREDYPLDTCNLTGFYDPQMLNRTDLVKDCFEELQSLVHSKFVAGEFYYTNTYYYTSDVYPLCTVICLPDAISLTTANAGFSTYSPKYLLYTTALSASSLVIALAIL